MPNNKPPAKTGKSKSASAPDHPAAASKSAAKGAGKKAGKPGKATKAAKAGADGAGIKQRVLEGLLINIVSELLKPEAGWINLAHQVADLFDKLPLSGFATLVDETTTSGAQRAAVDYNRAINGLLVTLTGIQAHATQLGEIIDRYGVATEQVVAQVATRLADTLASAQAPDYASIEKLVETYSFYLYLDRTMPAATVKEIKGKLKL